MPTAHSPARCWLGLARAELPQRLDHRAAPPPCQAPPAGRALCNRCRRSSGTRSASWWCLAVSPRTWGQPNQVGTQTFLVLWVMRTSRQAEPVSGGAQPQRGIPAAAPGLPAELLPPPPMNPLLPWSVLGSVVLAWLMVPGRRQPVPPPGQRAGGRCAGGVDAGVLAIAEHLLLVLPIAEHRAVALGHAPPRRQRDGGPMKNDLLPERCERRTGAFDDRDQPGRRAPSSSAAASAGWPRPFA
jgi:hypothetical protein